MPQWDIISHPPDQLKQIWVTTPNVPKVVEQLEPSFFAGGDKTALEDCLAAAYANNYTIAYTQQLRH